MSLTLNIFSSNSCCKQKMAKCNLLSSVQLAIFTVYFDSFCDPFTSFREGSLLISAHDSPTSAHYQKATDAACKGITAVQHSSPTPNLQTVPSWNELTETDENSVWQLLLETGWAKTIWFHYVLVTLSCSFLLLHIFFFFFFN